MSTARSHRDALLLGCATIVILVAAWIPHIPGSYILSDRLIAAVNGAPFQGGRAIDDRRLQEIDGRNFPLVAAFPELADELFRVPLCDCPTPIQRLTHLERALSPAAPGAGVALFAKNDGRSNVSIYGGNKVRKLELLLAHALYRGADEMFISGSAGSHSVLATALYAQSVGITPRIHLAPQVASPRVARNLVKLARITHRANHGGSIEYHDGARGVMSTITAGVVDAWASGYPAPFICPTGATSTLSTLGYVNAMYELAADIVAGHLPRAPSRIYVPAGSGGTFVGLLIGSRAIPMFRETEIIAVSSGSRRPAAQPTQHFYDVVAFLREKTGGRFPELSTSEEEISAILDRSFAGAGYGAGTPNASEAEALLAPDGLALESTYTAKAMARMIRDARNQPKAEGTPPVWLFWNTNSVESETLPPELHVEDPPTEADVDLVREFLDENQVQHYFGDVDSAAASE